MKHIVTIVLAAVFALPAFAAELAIDSAHSSVSFKVTHLVVSTVRGSFQAIEGTINLDEKDMTKSSVEVTIAANSVNTGNEKRDEHLRSADFFDTEKFDAITFKSKSIEKNGSGYVATGDLTIKGNTREMRLPFEMNGPITDPWGNTRIGVHIIPVTIDRQDFGLTWSKTLEAGGLMVGNDVTIEIDLEAVEAKSEPTK